jgi:hypothetical protein
MMALADSAPASRMPGFVDVLLRKELLESVSEVLQRRYCPIKHFGRGATALMFDRSRSRAPVDVADRRSYRVDVTPSSEDAT